MIDLKQERVLITGGSGFLGKALVRLLNKRDIDFISLSSKDVDLVDAYSTKKIISKYRPSVVFHLAAAVGGIEANKNNPAKFLHDNAIMGLNVIQSCNDMNIKKLVSVASACAYPVGCKIPFNENDLWNGYPTNVTAPYAMAKKLLSVAAKSYYDQYDFNSVVAYPTNLYGIEDNFNESTSHVVPALIKRCIKAKNNGDKELVIWGDGTATRDFLYVDDCASALYTLSEGYDSFEPINVGSGVETSIKKLVSTIVEIIGYTGELKFDTSQPVGQTRRCLDITKIKNEVGWSPIIDLRSGLENTINWFLQ